MNMTSRVLVTVLVLGATQQATADPPSFTGLGGLDGGRVFSLATGVSGDGSTVTGFAEDSARDDIVFRWTEQEGMTSTGVYSEASGLLGTSELIDHFYRGLSPKVSSDSSTIVGEAYFFSDGDFFFDEAFRWTESEGGQPLGSLGGGGKRKATGVSGDGSIVVGFSDFDSGNNEAFRWTESGGMVGLGVPPGTNPESGAFEISTDGSTIVGYQESSSTYQPFRWTLEDGMVPIVDETGRIGAGSAYDVSADGSVVVGFGIVEAGYEAFRWTEEDGIVGLGNITGGLETFGTFGCGVSADGSIVVGAGLRANEFIAFVWDADHGTRALKDVLTNDYGLDLTGWELNAALDVSADGRTIVGHGTNPDGDTEAFVAVVPEPSTFVLAGVAFVALSVCMWRKRRDH